VCGIGGVLDATGRVDLRAASDAMLLAMRHRGPDDAGAEQRQDHGLLLCATRLAIQDLSPLGHQPMSDDAGRIIAFNGEVYNAAELRADLERTGVRFRGRSDTEVALAGYAAWGNRVFERLQGMFAVALWDAPRRTLVLGRDPLGIKPLYVRDAGGVVAFASEVRALERAGLSDGQLSQAGLASFLATGSVAEPLTILDDVRMLPAGSVAEVAPGGRAVVTRTWSGAGAFAAPWSGSRADAVAQLRERLEAAARRHLVGDVPVGVFLSGGIDSSGLVSLAARADAQPPRTLSLVFAEQEYSEAAYIAEVARAFGTSHTQVELSAAQVLAGLDDVLAAMDQPSADGVNVHVISGVARSEGLKVVQSGLGGDELFGGYDTFRLVPQMDRLRRLTPGPLGPAAGWVAEHVRPGGHRGARLGRWLRRTGAAPDAYAQRRELLGAPDRAALLGGATPPAPAGERLRGADGFADISHRELTGYMRDTLLRDADAMSMAHGVELRVPYLDREIVELAAALPSEMKAAGRPKQLLVEAIGDLPAAVVERRKMGFTLPFDQWLRGALRGDVEGRLLDPAYGGAVADALDPAAVRATWDGYRDGRSTWLAPWALYALKRWGDQREGRDA
jgi:asparagine synthase (glutamine-hydrolysing)